MSNRSIGLDERLHAYLLEVGVREAPILARLREETGALPERSMQIAPEQGAFLALLVELLGARRCLEIGTFTGYSALSMARALPPGGTIVCCDVSEAWTTIARGYWADAGVAERIDLRLGPALATLDALLTNGEAGTFDLAFIDADKGGYPDYFERSLELVRPGGLIAVDNVLWSGRVADPAADEVDTVAMRAFNRRLATDERVSLSMIPIADGVTLARRRG